MTPYLAILRENKLKITPLRKAILEVFQKKQTAFTAEELWTMIRRHIPGAGLQSVYRNLADFVKAGLVEEIFLDKRKAAFALCNGLATHHHHAVCRCCGRSEEVDACKLDSMSRLMSRSFQRLRKRIGFKIERHFLQLEGLCHDCQKA